MSNQRAEHLAVSHIRFSKDVIDERFENGKKIGDVLTDLQTGLLDLDKLPKITVVKKGKLYFSLDNRRLWVFKEYAKFLEEKTEEILKIPVKYESPYRLETTWLTTTNEGESIKIQYEASSGDYINKETVRLAELNYSDKYIYKEDSKNKLDIKEPSELPVLQVVRRDGRLYALDNHNLWLIKHWFKTTMFAAKGKQHKHCSNGYDRVALGYEDPAEGAACSLGATDEKNIMDSKDDDSCDVYGDFTIQVELRPCHELPENVKTLNGGKSIEFKNRKSKVNKPKFKQLTRQDGSQEKRDLMKYGKAYMDQPRATYDFFLK